LNLKVSHRNGACNCGVPFLGYGERTLLRKLAGCQELSLDARKRSSAAKAGSILRWLTVRLEAVPFQIRAAPIFLSRVLDVTLLSACVEVDQRELGALAAFTGFDGHDVLVVFGADFQFRNRAGVLVTFQLFALIGVLIIIVP
jgi:hypothetical protein